MNGSSLHLSSPTQVLDIEFTRSAASRIHNALKQKQPSAGLTRSEIQAIARVVDFYACCEQWDAIVDISSRAIVTGVGPNARIKMYRAWSEALRANHDVDGLQTLAKHLLNHARKSKTHAALALLCLTYAGRTGLAKFLFSHLRRKLSKSPIVIEALTIHLCESVEKTQRNRGVKLYTKIANREKSSYFTSLNAVIYAFENENFELATKNLNALNKSFPLAPLPHLTAAQISFSQRQYTATLKSIQPVLDCNPNHAAAILVYAQCLEKVGDVLAAKRFLMEKEDLFDIADCDFALTFASILEQCAQRYDNTFDKNQAVNYYASALKTYQKLHLPEASLHIKLSDIHAGVLENKVTVSKNEAPKYWILAVDEKVAPAFLTFESMVVRCPADAKQGDVVFIARHQNNEKNLHIEGVFKFSSNVVPDCYFGNAARLDDKRIFEHAIDFKNDSSQQSFDAYRVQNFSENNYARYNEISHAIAEKIVERAETMNQRHQTHRKAV